MTTLRQRLAALSTLAALAVVLGFAAFTTAPASAQAPALELPPLPHEEGVLAIRGTGEIAADGQHLVISDQDGEIEVEGGELVVKDEDGSFEVRAYVIGGNNATATVHVRTTDREEFQQSIIFINCPEADECMSASDFHVEAGEGGTWLVDVEYGEGEHGAWQLEVYRDVASPVLYLPPFPAPPVHAVRGNGETLDDGRHLLVTDANSEREIVARGALIINDQDGIFEVVAYVEGPDHAQAQVNVYAGGPDGRRVDSRTVTIECSNADICLQTIEFEVTAAPGRYAVDVEHVTGDLGPWQLEVYNFVTPAPAEEEPAAADDGGSDSLQPDEEADAAEEDDSLLAADDEAAADDDSMMDDGADGGAADDDGSMMDDGTDGDAADDDDSMMDDGVDGDAADEDGSMMDDGADGDAAMADEPEGDDAMSLPTGGTGGLFQGSARTTIPVAVSLAGLIAGLAIFSIALRARRNAA